MLITLRNSGAESILYTPKVSVDQLMKIIDKSENSSGYYDILLKGEELDSFILDKNNTKIENIHLNLSKNNWSGNPSKTYQIKILTEKGDYRLHYTTGTGKPDFFKRIFKYFYPEQAENQIEEMV